ncbi:hypothetical protein CYY_006485 [Polysphondylium violaceum]|uniref:phosphatidylinositol 3-kinase n=1 Tax=Polysphondylium violaceum TaxID=133409 RepID=A0A8J4PRU1_9MYCE|nr:hypothetical protein CYY_006485 [Polysphondylium violaceum]
MITSEPTATATMNTKSGGSNGNIQKQQQEKDAISPLSLSSDHNILSSSPSISITKSGGNTPGSGGSSSGSFKKNSTIYNGPLPSLDDGSEFTIENKHHHSGSFSKSPNKPNGSNSNISISPCSASSLSVSISSDQQQSNSSSNNNNSGGSNSGSNSGSFKTPFDILDEAINSPLGNRNSTGSSGSGSSTSIGAGGGGNSSNSIATASTATISIQASASPFSSSESSPNTQSPTIDPKDTMNLLDLICNLPSIPTTHPKLANVKSSSTSTSPIMSPKSSSSPSSIKNSQSLSSSSIKNSPSNSSNSLVNNNSSNSSSSKSSTIASVAPTTKTTVSTNSTAAASSSSTVKKPTTTTTTTSSSTQPMPHTTTTTSYSQKLASEKAAATTSVVIPTASPPPVSMKSISTPTLNNLPTQQQQSPVDNHNNYNIRVKSKQYSMLNLNKKSVVEEFDSINHSPRLISPLVRGSISGSSPTLSPPPNNKPLVVKKTAESSRSIWRSTMASTKEDHIKVVFDIPSMGKRLIQKFSIDMSPNEIKTKMLEELGPEYATQADQYDLKVLSINHIVTNETLPLRRQLLMQACNISRLFPKLFLVAKDNGASNTSSSTLINSKTGLPLVNDSSTGSSSEPIDLKSHIQVELEIFELIGSSFARTLESGQEVVSFRRDFAQFRLSNFTSTRNDLSQMIYVLSEPMPLSIPSKITIMVLLPGDGKIVKRVDCDPNTTVKEVKTQIFKKFSMIDRTHTSNKTANDFVLKVTGFREYILSVSELGNLTNRQRFYPTGAGGDFAMIDYDYVRQCIGKGQLIELSLINNSILSQSQVEEKVSFIDKILETSDYDDYDEDIDHSSSQSLDELNFINIDHIQSNNSANNLVRDSFDSTNSSEASSPNLDHNSSNSNSNIQGGSGGIINNLSNNNINNNYPMTMGSMIGTQQFMANAIGSKLPINKVNRLFRVKTVGLRNINFNSNDEAKSKFIEKTPYVFVMIEIYFGGELIANPEYSSIIPVANFETLDFPDWERDVWTPFNISIKNLPRAARASFTVYVTSVSEVSESGMEDVVNKSIPIGWSNCQLIDHKGCLRTGPCAFKLWEDGRKANPIGTCVGNLAAKTPIMLLVEFESFIKPVVYVSPNIFDSSASSMSLNGNKVESPPKKLEPLEAKKLHSLIQADPLVKLSPEDKKLIYTYRHIYKSKPKALAKFLQSVNWIEPEQTIEAFKQMVDWAPLKPVQALEMLDAKFADETTRAYAVKCINSFTDAEFSDFLLQLTQVLKYEPYHNSDLTHILIQRALANRSRIGHFFFWFLKSEMHTPEIEERYGLLLEGYLRSCGSHRQELIKQNQVLKSLYQVAMQVKNTNGSSERRKVLGEGLSKIKFPDTFQLPLDPRWEAKGLIIDKCRYMDSKKLPLWLVFENVEPHAKPLTVIFKVGDDLRQDILTLQVLRIMDKFWKNSGMDLRLQPYKCIATGDGIGMLEVVLNANTIANINKDAGGTGALLEEKTLVNWLKECNPTELEFNKAVENFILSCAGYVVATYVMGIGDRHSDNIMMTKSGHLFHIDFGHFLGNYKKKYGFKRERAPFIFTPQYMAIVGGKDSENFKFFVNTCCSAFNILRKNTDLFLNLFQLMLSTGIPELQCAEDIDYLRKALAPDLTDDEAAEEFTKNIIVALNTKTVLLNDIFHGWAH